MATKGIQLAWIVVKNLNQAIEFYTKTVGLTLREHNSEFGWAELSGPEGAILGIAEENPHMKQKAGINGVVTITVTDIDAARKKFLNQGAKLIGDIEEIPNHVKMQTFSDQDGNLFQLVEPQS